ncbi:putative patatin-like phospholipase [Actinoplanes missouriensis 431]|uniref:Putative patatin-like phospholipase n=1 Tax=Actinoplanes missouriensis (strain ATCC 14538 / DSM 43046 / CBS 188.64 / JCM 3121 / NBRC 102363 / NCIMB 12654 / NRRL B-3342 / UNCC 431) TaxID=512565 RepID=I0H920_ACTM4|nr:patatin-like phospholipase family protein [Actinoplanes missouriensis]BAL89507.1 putative patatin-like phospholipase [Actinoplanes missouriensis 431]
MTKALVLGGGGVTGIAWHLGLLCGLQRAGVPLGGADTIVGTSAGSVVGTLLAAGVDLEAAVAEQLREVAPRPGGGGGGGRGTGQFLAALAVLADPSVPPQQARAQVGAMALTAPTADEATYLSRMEPLIPVRDWPERDLRLVVVDAADGRDLVLDRASGATLLQAVSASCAVPGLMPPVTIGDARYMDGGVRLGAGADLAAGADHLVVIAPMAALSRDRIRAEMASTGAGKTLLVEPDEAALEAFGPNFMDPSRRPAAAGAGLRQGEALAEAVRAVWPA